ncbi:MAG: hypothetical protein RLW62_21125 [Gammaproteobacteria bacterium]
MTALRILLVALFATLTVYTSIVASRHGLDLLAVFFRDIVALNWPGQFNVDFMSYLALSALWLAWRHHFSPAGIALGVLGFFGGGLVFTTYLFVASLAAHGDPRVLALGAARARG